MEDDRERKKATVHVWLLKTDEDPSSEMLTAYHLCEQYRSNGISAEWISEEVCMKKNRVTKKDVFVLETFSGRVFEKLSSTKTIIVGPKCLSCCLNDGEEIPRGATFTVAMRNIVITISNFTTSEKEKMTKCILWMGGRCEKQLTEETTHLISNTVTSDKYIKATSRGIPVMKAEWVEAVWKESLKKNISADNEQFDNYKLPIFFGISASTTAIKSKREKKNIIEHITKNGGEFHMDFASRQNNLLILNNDGIGSQKHACAVEYNISCVTPAWVSKSVESGYALDQRNFAVGSSNINAPNTSSPNRTQLPDMSINVSCIPKAKVNSFADDTCSTTTGESTFMPSALQDNQRVKNVHLSKIAKEYARLIDNIEMKSVKQAGSFLDGCCIYVYGASPIRRDKLQRIVSLAGGVRFDDPDEAITHSICCDPTIQLTMEQVSAMPSANHVTVLWLIESIKSQKAVDEVHYSVSSAEHNFQTNSVKKKIAMPSPMSKRNMQLLQTQSVRPPVPIFKLDAEEEENNDEIVQQYISQKSNLSDENQNPEPQTTLKLNVNEEDCDKDTTLKNNENPDNDTQKDEDETDAPDEQELVFNGLTFELRDIEEEADQIIAQITEAGGLMAKRPKRNFKHYILVPMNYDGIDCNNLNSEMVTSAWLEDCLNTESIVPIDYYHRPVKFITNTMPLSKLVISISNYVGSERTFLSEIATLLGATVSPTLHKRMTTHLLCAEASGAKYEGCINWGITVVNNQWLLDCLAAGKRVRERPYLVGSSKEPEWDDEPSENEISEIKDISTPTGNVHENINRDKSIDINAPNQNDGNEIENIQPNEFILENKLLSKIDKISSHSSPLRKSTKLSLGNTEMSPASRYIAMNRQGMISNSQDTPRKSEEDEIKIISQPNDTMSTPPMDNALSTPNLALFSSQSKRRILAVKRGEIPSNPPRTPKNPFNLSIATPESPFGASLRPGSNKMSAESRKKLKKFCDEFPSPVMKEQTKQETPVTELMNRFFSKYSDNSSTPKSSKREIFEKDIKDTDLSIPPAKQLKLSNEPTFSKNLELQDQLKLLDTILTSGETSHSVSTPHSIKTPRSTTTLADINNANIYMENIDSTGKSRYIGSQTDTVGWDDMTECLLPKRFLLAQNVHSSDEMKCLIERLGGTVIDGNDFDVTVTHYLCSYLSRSEKFLICLAARKWILHPDYIIESQKAGRFIDEEFYEWGNPKAKIDLKSVNESQKQLANAIYRWHRNSSSSNPIFHNFKVILVLKESRKASMSRVLKAGGAEVLNISSPFKGNIDATHCFLEPQYVSFPKADMEHLAKLKIPVCLISYISAFLINDSQPNIEDFLCPDYKSLMN